MLKKSKIFISLTLATAMPAIAAATPGDIVVKAHPTFRDLEYDHSGNDRIEVAKALLNARIPVGTGTSLARAVVREDGARCGTAVENGQTRCTFSSIESVDDQLHDVVWTVRLNSLNGRIANLDVTRESVGS